MIRTTSLILAALFPLLAGAQSQALKAAKGARETSDAGNLKIMQAADAAPVVQARSGP